MGRQDKKDKPQSFSGGSFADLLAQAGKISTDKAKEIKKEVEKENKSEQKNTNTEMSINHISSVKFNRKAHAPYNFISLNEKVIEYNSDTAMQNDKYHIGNNTGYINIDIETVTPIYTRDIFTSYDIAKKNEMERDKKQTFIKSSFYSPTGKPALPGSSIRGMTRTLIEILSFSKFGFVNKNTNYYYRAMADECHSNRDSYMNIMHPNEKGKTGTYRMSSGILSKEGLNYVIYHVSDKPVKIPKKEARTLIESKYKNYKTHTSYEFDDKYIVVSGDAPPKKNKKGEMVYKEVDWLIEKSTNYSRKISVSKEDIINYIDDTNRDKKVPDLIELAKKKNKVPCFYIEWEDSNKEKRVSFGYNPMFRLPYFKSVNDHIPTEHNKDISDISESIFGNENKFATRVFFEDCILSGNQNDVLMEEKIIKILSNPKPTTFQHYLVQTTDEITKLNHYNTPNASIRGNKMYWHKNGNNWQEDKVSISEDRFENFLSEYKLNRNEFPKPRNRNIDIDLKTLSPRLSKCLMDSIGKYETQHTKVQAVKPKTRFSGKIRFENLSDIELGALLQSLNLPEGCMHKIGMGKPHGLGSIKITPKLYLSDRKNRYTSLFSEWSETPEFSDINKYITVFQNYITSSLKEKSYWDIQRLKELKTMLNYEKGCQLENEKIIFNYKEKGQEKSVERYKTEYMTISPNEFKKRPILPLSTDV